MNLIDLDHIKLHGQEIALSVLYEKACESGLFSLATAIELYWESQLSEDDFNGAQEQSIKAQEKID